MNMRHGQSRQLVVAATVGEEFIHREKEQDWIVSWNPPDSPQDGDPHGSAGICATDDGGVVLISNDAESWGLPGGRPEGNEMWEETLVREIQEEACAELVHARLLGFCRAACVNGPEAGRVIVRSLWRAVVELGPWEPRFEIAHRRVVAASEVLELLRRSEGDDVRKATRSPIYTAGRLSKPASQPLTPTSRNCPCPSNTKSA